jgi:Dihydrodipicolinate synthetase family
METGFLSGVMAALVTPLHEDGTLDESGLARLMERVARSSDGISPAGSTGEGALLTREQRRELTARVRQLAPPGMPVIPRVPLVTVADGRAAPAAAPGPDGRGMPSRVLPGQLDGGAGDRGRLPTPSRAGRHAPVPGGTRTAAV